MMLITPSTNLEKGTSMNLGFRGRMENRLGPVAKIGPKEHLSKLLQQVVIKNEKGKPLLTH